MVTNAVSSHRRCGSRRARSTWTVDAHRWDARTRPPSVEIVACRKQRSPVHVPIGHQMLLHAAIRLRHQHVREAMLRERAIHRVLPALTFGRIGPAVAALDLDYRPEIGLFPLPALARV